MEVRHAMLGSLPEKLMHMQEAKEKKES
jgi:hypothetical protein